LPTYRKPGQKKKRKRKERRAKEDKEGGKDRPRK